MYRKNQTIDITGNVTSTTFTPISMADGEFFVGKYDKHFIEQNKGMDIIPIYFDHPLKGEVQTSNSSTASAVISLAQKVMEVSTTNTKSIVGRRWLSPQEHVSLMFGVLDAKKHDVNTTIDSSK